MEAIATFSSSTVLYCGYQHMSTSSTADTTATTQQPNKEVYVHERLAECDAVSRAFESVPLARSISHPISRACLATAASLASVYLQFASASLAVDQQRKKGIRDVGIAVVKQKANLSEQLRVDVFFFRDLRRQARARVVHLVVSLADALYFSHQEIRLLLLAIEARLLFRNRFLHPRKFLSQIF